MKDISRPVAGEFPEYFENYYKHVPAEGNVYDLLVKANFDTIDLITSVDWETLDFRYAEGKWNIPEIIQHVMDSERIFAYRALCIARNDQTSLPGFDENAYAANSFSANRNIMDIAREFSLLRASTIELLKSFPESAHTTTGTANGKPISVRALAYVILGHELHHVKIIEERYLPK